MKEPRHQVENAQCRVNVDFVLLPHFSLLTFAAAADALTTANLVTGQPRFTFRTLSLGEPDVVSDLGVDLPVHASIARSTEIEPAEGGAVTVVLVCGGYRCKFGENRVLSEYLRAREQQGDSVGGLWNGVLSVALAGLMDGHGCALHPDDHSRASSNHPQMSIRPDTLVMDGNRMSAAGPSSAFELMLMLIGRHDSIETVHAIRQVLKADTSSRSPKRSAGVNGGETELPANLRSALQMMRNHLDGPISRQALAEHMNLSIRAMERVFQQYLQTSPALYYRQLRLQLAHDLLTKGDTPIAKVSDLCGFVSAAHFSRSFQQFYGQSPSQVRRSTPALLDR